MTDQTTDSSIIPNVSNERLASVLIFIAPVFFVSNIMIAKMTADSIPPIHLAFLRWMATFLVMSFFVGPQLWAHRKALLSEWFDLTILGALGMGVCGAFVYIGADTTSAINIGLIYSVSPVLIILLAALIYKEDVTLRQIIGVICSLMGVLVIISRAELSALFSLIFTVGDLWLVAAMLGWSVYSVMLRHRPTAMNLPTRFAAITLYGVIVLAPFTVWEAYSGDVPEYDWELFGWIVLLALVPSFGAYQLYGFIQKTLGAGRTSPFMYLLPVYSAALAWLLLGEQPEYYHWIGAGLVLPGLMLAVGAKKK